MNMATIYSNGLKNFPQAEEMYKRALDGKEKSLRKDHVSITECARNLACIYQASEMNSKPLMAELVKKYPDLMEFWWVSSVVNS